MCDVCVLMMVLCEDGVKCLLYVVDLFVGSFDVMDVLKVCVVLLC